MCWEVPASGELVDDNRVMMREKVVDSWFLAQIGKSEQRADGLRRRRSQGSPPGPLGHRYDAPPRTRTDRRHASVLPARRIAGSVPYASVHPVEAHGFDGLSDAVERLAPNDTGLEVQRTGGSGGGGGWSGRAEMAGRFSGRG